MPKSRARRKPTARRAAPAKQPLVRSPAPGLRGRVEVASAPVLLWLSARPKFFVPLLSVVLLVAGLAAPPAVGVPLLVLLALLVGWLSYLSWPVVAGVQRVVRLVTLGLVLFALAGRLSG